MIKLEQPRLSALQFERSLMAIDYSDQLSQNYAHRLRHDFELKIPYLKYIICAHIKDK